MTAPAPTATAATATGSPVTAGEPVIRLDGLTKRFGTGADSLLAVDDVSFEVRPGEVVALLGLSGSGKSTLLSLLDGLQAPTSGDGTVLGTALARAGRSELRALRRRIGFVFQQFHLVGRLSVLENVCTGALGSLRGPRLGLLSYPRAVRERALDGLEQVGLAAHAFQRADTLSGGQQQRVAVARALMQEPGLLLADEPVASLDPESSAQVMRLLARVAQERELTVLCSLHQVDLALSWAHRIIGLRSGRVVMDVATEGIDRGTVMRLYEEVAAGSAEGVAAAVAAGSAVPPRPAAPPGSVPAPVAASAAFTKGD
ncbi:phosphonate ABC transporter ATP-binding protein [Streptomyces violaceusniger]|uniref:Phosphonate ABC transporter, ATPase subunit n=1 Tax=Streptomyces violaceusniger (strain Tu 4113) TaxID=653045 RepID=G2NV94_STRV4|nr:phosphonate ABC transporter ATP-binding protein [Streptomyces violaceusniger]AEM85436.1 phosphonate ABC transporter, ATPase subunit [Streptomyces violaceusniger Tu 4113]